VLAAASVFDVTCPSAFNTSPKPFSVLHCRSWSDGDGADVVVRQLQGVLPRISFRKCYGSISHSNSDLNHCAAGKDGDRADVGAAAALQTLSRRPF